MKARWIVIACVVGLAAGFGVGRALSSQSATGPVEEKTYKAKAKIADQGESATVAALRTRIAQLEKALAERAAQVEEARTNAVAEAGRHRGDPRKFFEELKVKDPERYAQITNRMAQWQARRAAMARSRMEYLASIDVSHMSAGAKKVHNELQDLLAQREEIERQLQNPDLTDDARRSLFGQLHETRGKLNQLNRQERSNLLSETAKELGFTGNDVKDITSTIQDVIEATSSGHGGPPGPPPRGGQGGGPGGAGGPPAGGPGGPM